VSDKDIYVRGWGAVTTLGWSAPESAKNLIEGKVLPAKAGEVSHLISSEFKSFAVPYDGDPLSKSQKMLEGALGEAIERAGLSQRGNCRIQLVRGNYRRPFYPQRI